MKFGLNIGFQSVVLADELVEEGPLNAILELEIPEVRENIASWPLCLEVVLDHGQLLP